MCSYTDKGVGHHHSYVQSADIVVWQVAGQTFVALIHQY